jgi:hypothetical protein
MDYGSLHRVWYELQVRIAGREIAGFVNGLHVLSHTASAPVSGHGGLWTKADALIRFSSLSLSETDRRSGSDAADRLRRVMIDHSCCRKVY